MGILSSIFGSPRPRQQATTAIKNILGETILEVPVPRLAGSSCLRGKDLSHADLRGQSFCGADLREVILLGADLRGCEFAGACLRNANLAYALVDGASFQRAELDNVDLLHTDVRLAQLEGANITPTSTIPRIRVVYTRPEVA